jgi:hypothetical protein
MTLLSENKIFILFVNYFYCKWDRHVPTGHEMYLKKNPVHHLFYITLFYKSVYYIYTYYFVNSRINVRNGLHNFNRSNTKEISDEKVILLCMVKQNENKAKILQNVFPESGLESILRVA